MEIPEDYKIKKIEGGWILQKNLGVANMSYPYGTKTYLFVQLIDLFKFLAEEYNVVFPYEYPVTVTGDA